MTRHDRVSGTRRLCDPTVFAELRPIARRCAVDDARTMGLLDPDGPGTCTRPDLSRMVYADGKAPCW